MPVKMQEMIKLKQVSIPLHQIKTLGSKDSAYTAFRKFAETGLEILPGMDGKKVLGVVSKKSVMHRLVWEFKFGKLGKVKKRKHKQK